LARVPWEIPSVLYPLGTNLFTWASSSIAGELFTFEGNQTLGNPVRIQFSRLTFNRADDLTFTGVTDFNNSNRVLNVTSNGILRFTGTLSNATGLTKIGSGVLKLGGTNVATLNNGLYIVGGTVRVLANDLIAYVGDTIRMTNIAQILDMNGFSDTVRGLTAANGSRNWAGTLDNTAAGITSILTLGDQFTYAMLGQLQNTGPGSRLALVEACTGALIVSNANSFSGGLTDSNENQIYLESIGAAGTGPISLAATNAEVTYSGGGSITLTNDIILEAGASSIISATDGNALEVAGVISGPVTGMLQ